MADQYLLCRDQDGSLVNVAHIVGGGIELQGRIISLEMLQELLGPKACVTFTDERLVDATSLSAAIAAAKSASPQQSLLEDENDEFCLICSLGGDLICCETCPATFHTECIGLSEVPQDDWFCPACRRCSARPASGGKETKKSKGNKKSKANAPIASTTPIELIPCSNYSSHRLPTTDEVEEEEKKEESSQEKNEKDQGVNGQSKSNLLGDLEEKKKRPKRSKLWNYQKLHLEEAGQPPPLYTIQLQQKKAIQPQHPLTADEEERESIATTAAKKKDGKEEEYQRQRSLAECCALGEIPIANFSAASKQIQVSFQLIHTAAAAGVGAADGGANGTATTSSEAAAAPYGNSTMNNCMIMPGYTEAQRSDLQHILSAALHLVRSVYAPLVDSRTGLDVLPWLFRGKTFPSGCADYSTMYVAVLYVGSTIAGAACVRSLGNSIAEIPIFTIRYELRRNHLGEHFLSQIEKVLQQAGIKSIITPAMILPGWPFTPSSLPREKDDEMIQKEMKNSSSPLSTNFGNIPLPMQSRWGYTLATKEEMQRIAHVRPLAFPGIYTCVKHLLSSSQQEEKEAPPPIMEAATEAGKSSPIVSAVVTAAAAFPSKNTPLTPRSLPVSLTIAPEIKVQVLRDMGFIEFRCDQGTSSVIPVNPAPGFELIIQNAGDDIEYHQGGIAPAGARGVSRLGARSGAGTGNGIGTAGGGDRSTGTGRGTGTESNKQKQLQLEHTQQPISLLGQPKPATTGKRKYTKRKLKGEGTIGVEGKLDGINPNPSGAKKPTTITMPGHQPPQVLQMQQQEGLPQHQQQGGGGTRMNMTTGGFLPDPYLAGGMPIHSSSQLLPPGAPPLLHSLVYPSQLLPVQDGPMFPTAIGASPAEEYAAVQNVQRIQAHQLAEMEDAILRNQANLLQGMAVFREQQQQLTIIQQQQQQQQPYFQQQFDELPPLQSIYENHQRLQQQQLQLQNTMALNTMASPLAQQLPPPPPMTTLAPGYLYHPSSSQPQAQHQQQQLNQIHPLMPPPTGPSSYHYGNGSGGGGNGG